MSLTYLKNRKPEIFAVSQTNKEKYKTNKGFTYNLCKVNISKYSNPQEKGDKSNRKRANDINEQLTKEEIQNANKEML